MLFPQLTIESRPGLLCFILGITSVSKYLAFSPYNSLKQKKHCFITQLHKAVDIMAVDTLCPKDQLFGILHFITPFTF